MSRGEFFDPQLKSIDKSKIILRHNQNKLYGWRYDGNEINLIFNLSQQATTLSRDTFINSFICSLVSIFFCCETKKVPIKWAFLRMMNDRLENDSNRRNSQPGNRLQVDTLHEADRRGSDSLLACNSPKKYYELKVMQSAEKSLLLENVVKIPIPPTVPPSVADPKMASEKKRRAPKEESFCSIAMEVSIPFLVAGMGMVGAGLVLNMVQVINNYYGHHFFLLIYCSTFRDGKSD